MAPPQPIPILDQMEKTSVQVSHIWSPGGCHIWLRAPGLPDATKQLVTSLSPRKLASKLLCNKRLQKRKKEEIMFEFAF